VFVLMESCGGPAAGAVLSVLPFTVYPLFASQLLGPSGLATYLEQPPLSLAVRREPARIPISVPDTVIGFLVFGTAL